MDKGLDFKMRSWLKSLALDTRSETIKYISDTFQDRNDLCHQYYHNYDVSVTTVIR